MVLLFTDHICCLHEEATKCMTKLFFIHACMNYFQEFVSVWFKGLSCDGSNPANV